jgi:hypothetical protein
VTGEVLQITEVPVYSDPVLLENPLRGAAMVRRQDRLRAPRTHYAISARILTNVRDKGTIKTADSLRIETGKEGRDPSRCIRLSCGNITNSEVPK